MGEGIGAPEAELATFNAERETPSGGQKSQGAMRVTLVPRPARLLT